MKLVSSLRRFHHYFFKERIQRLYTIDGFLLDMGQDHPLSLTQKYNPMYDRFLPYLGKLVSNIMENSASSDKSIIIDIGANVGDSCAGMIKHNQADFVCIEPTTKFYNLLKKNVQNFGKVYSQRILLIKAYISEKSDEKFCSRVINGTAIKEDITGTTIEAEAPTYSLSDLYEHLNINPKQVKLIKIDTDGFDSECILSLEKKLEESFPLLYWENQIDTEKQHGKFIQMLNYLKKNSYEDFFVFDNFGNYLCKTDIDGIKDINDYLLRILNKKSTRSFFYVDVLACKKQYTPLCKKIIKEYLSEFI